MGRDFTQETWDEYMSTGIDPTGGELGPDFDPATGRPLSEPDKKENSAEDAESLEEVYDWDGWYARTEAAIDQKIAELNKVSSPPNRHNNSGGWSFNWHDVFIAAGILFFIFAGINAIVKNNAEKTEKAKIEQDKASEAARPVVYTLPDPGLTPEEKAAETARIRQEVKELLKSGRGLYGEGVTPSIYSSQTTPKSSGLPQRGTAFGDGYWDGYEEGYDDADGHNTYGFKYNESGGKYSGRATSEYIRGYRIGYKEGWEEGIEQLQDRYDNGDDELDEEEF